MQSNDKDLMFITIKKPLPGNIGRMMTVEVGSHRQESDEEYDKGLQLALERALRALRESDKLAENIAPLYVEQKKAGSTQRPQREQGSQTESGGRQRQESPPKDAKGDSICPVHKTRLYVKETRTGKKALVCREKGCSDDGNENYSYWFWLPDRRR